MIAEAQVPFSAGTRVTMLPVQGHMASTAICYEVTYPQLAREAVLQGSELLAPPFKLERRRCERRFPGGQLGVAHLGAVVGAALEHTAFPLGQLRRDLLEHALALLERALAPFERGAVQLDRTDLLTPLRDFVLEPLELRVAEGELRSELVELRLARVEVGGAVAQHPLDGCP